MFREQIKVLDCTIRDGGIMNDWQFSKETVHQVWSALRESGVDYMEVGYKADRKMFSVDKFGCWRFCREEDLREVLEPSDLKLSAMCDVGRTDYNDILPKDQSVLDLIRVATYVQDIDKAIDMAKCALDRGYEVSVNIMAISHALDRDLNEALAQLAETDVHTVVIVDSFGALYSEQVHYLVDKYRQYLGDKKEIGIHMHNNQQLGFGNTIEGIIKGCNRLDATVFGVGRGAGNCPLELLMSFLKNPKFRLGPILQLITDVFLPLSKEIDWGYHIPYMITGVLDEHPKLAMQFMASERKHEYREFWREMLESKELA